LKIQAQNDKLINLYISTYQLHATLDKTEVCSTINEILINLIGAEEFFVSMFDDEKENLQIIICECNDAFKEEETMSC
jgi:nitrate/nitrite-specific signal transduction histidine kinase